MPFLVAPTGVWALSRIARRGPDRSVAENTA
ncbi:hypothetical protein SRABI128_03778 [Microbacterium sp. Bi128]|nr:hypothetical protein SRABI128_03778 [Microbacterium sp. Bi128]